MNFKFTKGKVWISLSVSIIISVVIALSKTCFGCSPSKDLLGKLALFLISFVGSFILIYVIWSLIQKKK